MNPPSCSASRVGCPSAICLAPPPRTPPRHSQQGRFITRPSLVTPLRTSHPHVPTHTPRASQTTCLCSSPGPGICFWKTTKQDIILLSTPFLSSSSSQLPHFYEFCFVTVLGSQPFPSSPTVPLPPARIPGPRPPAPFSQSLARRHSSFKHAHFIISPPG